MNDHGTAEEWFMNSSRAGEDDLDSLTDELLLDVTEQLYVRMTELGLRPTDLAERLGVSRAYVSQLLNGRPNMTMRTLVGVAHVLGQRVHVQLKPRGAVTAEQVTPDDALPWLRYLPAQQVEGRVVNVSDVDVFVELEPGVVGLIHRTHLQANGPDPRFARGQLVRVQILAVDATERRMELGLSGP